MRDPYVQRARALIGTRFRAQGREPASGLDCIGLVAAVFGIPGERLPRDYRLRGGAIARLQHGLDAYFRRVRPSLANAGDVLLFEVSAD